jgi:hypothetical protein
MDRYVYVGDEGVVELLGALVSDFGDGFMSPASSY